MTLFYGLGHQESWTFPLLFFLVRLGTSSAFATVYVGNREVFPALIATSAMGIIQVPARLASAIVSFCSQMEEPTPMIIFTSLSLAAMIAALFIRTVKDNEAEKK